MSQGLLQLKKKCFSFFFSYKREKIVLDLKKKQLWKKFYLKTFTDFNSSYLLFRDKATYPYSYITVLKKEIEFKASLPNKYKFFCNTTNKNSNNPIINYKCIKSFLSVLVKHRKKYIFADYKNIVKYFYFNFIKYFVNAVNISLYKIQISALIKYSKLINLSSHYDYVIANGILKKFIDTSQLKEVTSFSKTLSNISTLSCLQVNKNYKQLYYFNNTIDELNTFENSTLLFIYNKFLFFFLPGISNLISVKFFNVFDKMRLKVRNKNFAFNVFHKITLKKKNQKFDLLTAIYDILGYPSKKQAFTFKISTKNKNLGIALIKLSENKKIVSNFVNKLYIINFFSKIRTLWNFLKLPLKKLQYVNYFINNIFFFKKIFIKKKILFIKKKKKKYIYLKKEKFIFYNYYLLLSFKQRKFLYYTRLNFLFFNVSYRKQRKIKKYIHYYIFFCFFKYKNMLTYSNNNIIYLYLSIVDSFSKKWNVEQFFMLNLRDIFSFNCINIDVSVTKYFNKYLDLVNKEILYSFIVDKQNLLSLNIITSNNITNLLSFNKFQYLYNNDITQYKYINIFLDNLYKHLHISFLKKKDIKYPFYNYLFVYLKNFAKILNCNFKHVNVSLFLKNKKTKRKSFIFNFFSFYSLNRFYLQKFNLFYFWKKTNIDFFFATELQRFRYYKSYYTLNKNKAHKICFFRMTKYIKYAFQFKYMQYFLSKGLFKYLSYNLKDMFYPQASKGIIIFSKKDKIKQAPLSYKYYMHLKQIIVFFFFFERFNLKKNSFDFKFLYKKNFLSWNIYYFWSLYIMSYIYNFKKFNCDLDINNYIYNYLYQNHKLSPGLLKKDFFSKFETNNNIKISNSNLFKFLKIYKQINKLSFFNKDFKIYIKYLINKHLLLYQLNWRDFFYKYKHCFYFYRKYYMNSYLKFPIYNPNYNGISQYNNNNSFNSFKKWYNKIYENLCDNFSEIDSEISNESNDVNEIIPALNVRFKHLLNFHENLYLYNTCGYYNYFKRKFFKKKEIYNYFYYYYKHNQLNSLTVSKIISSTIGIISIFIANNNTFVTLTDIFGNVLFVSNGGLSGITGPNRGTSVTSEEVTSNVCDNLEKKNIKLLILKFSGVLFSRKIKSALKVFTFLKNIKIIKILNNTPKSHNGIRLKKKKRL